MALISRSLFLFLTLPRWLPVFETFRTLNEFAQDQVYDHIMLTSLLAGTQ